jgi:hypothetical protein
MNLGFLFIVFIRYCKIYFEMMNQTREVLKIMKKRTNEDA